jgi:hypothetical protein
MDDLLRQRGFMVRVLKEQGATRDGILAGYRDLIEDSTTNDAAVVYYSGHGARYANPDSGKGQQAWLQFILPVDIDATTEDDFRGLFADELSLLQYQLTKKTKNVTVILDCCHSARMSRGEARPKSWKPGHGWPQRTIAQQFATVSCEMAKARAEAGDDRWFDANPDAVRLVACAPKEIAFEIDDTDTGGTHGALTDAFVSLVGHLGNGRATWDNVAERLRSRLLEHGLVQRPEAEGPTNRLLFSAETVDVSGAMPIIVEAATAYVDHAVFFGLEANDELLVMRSGEGFNPQRAIAKATVVKVVGDCALLDLTYLQSERSLPSGAEAYPLRIALGRPLVVVEPETDPRWSTVVESLKGLPHVRVAVTGQRAMAHVRLEPKGYELIGPDFKPMHEVKPVDQQGLGELSRNLGIMARATHLQELQSGQGDEELNIPVAVEWWTGTKDAPQRREMAGERVRPGDRLFIQVTNEAKPGNGSSSVWANVFDIGMRSKITLLNTSEPSGLELSPGRSYVIGTEPGLRASGLGLSWPRGLPIAGPRRESIIAIFSDIPQDLRRLDTVGLRGRGSPESSLMALLDSVKAGTRELTRDETLPTVRYRVERIDFLVEPDSP